MTVETKTIIRHLNEIEKEKSTCGFRKRLVAADDRTPLSASYVAINEAKPHYHKETTEFYYVLEGEGTIELDGTSIPVSPGSSVLIPPNVRHRAVGNIAALVVGTPPFHTDDLFLVDD